MPSVAQNREKHQDRPDYQARLLDAARAYAAYGWTVIPLCGDADADLPTSAAVWWPPYQTYRPDDDDLMYWFSVRKFRALALLTGELSRLAVLVLARFDLLAAFAATFPDLAQTRRVAPGDGNAVHLYFRLNFETVTSRSVLCPGAALLMNGSYVVAPPSVIAGGVWYLAADVRLATITGARLGDLGAWLAALPANRHEFRDEMTGLDVTKFDSTGAGAGGEVLRSTVDLRQPGQLLNQRTLLTLPAATATSSATDQAPAPYRYTGDGNASSLSRLIVTGDGRSKSLICCAAPPAPASKPLDQRPSGSPGVVRRLLKGAACRVLRSKIVRPLTAAQGQNLVLAFRNRTVSKACPPARCF